MATRLAREEGLYAVTSTEGNVVAALRLAERLGPDATIVTVMRDTGMKHLKSVWSKRVPLISAGASSWMVAPMDLKIGNGLRPTRAAARTSTRSPSHAKQAAELAGHQDDN
jgi:hypothetical protein